MNFLKRIFKIGQAEANAAMDKMEDPITMTEQGIRDLKADLVKAIESLAKVKAIAIRSKTDADDYAEKASAYENKALLLLQKAEKGELKAAEADRLATEALVLKNSMEENGKQAKEEQAKNEKNVSQMQSNIEKLKATISKWENELKTLKARHKVSEATKSINKQLADMDSDSTVDLLNRMKDKIAEQEALSDAYAEISNENKSIENEIDDVLDTKKESAKTDLEKLKEKIRKNKK